MRGAGNLGRLPKGLLSELPGAAQALNIQQDQGRKKGKSKTPRRCSPWRGLREIFAVQSVAH